MKNAAETIVIFFILIECRANFTNILNTFIHCQNHYKIQLNVIK